MKIEFRRAAVPQDIRSLILFDRKAFHRYPSDWFSAENWEHFDSWWMLLNERRIGCSAFETKSKTKLEIVSTAILPNFQGQGFGELLKCWQIAYARHHGFTRIGTNTRKSNKPMINLNKKFGFKILRTAPDYYIDPRESTVVMELKL